MTDRLTATEDKHASREMQKVAHIIHSADLDRDGRLSFYEFRSLLARARADPRERSEVCRKANPALAARGRVRER